MPPAPPAHPPTSRLAPVLAGGALVATALSDSISDAYRVRLGLDFADEMQYYGEIASLVRTHQLFHDDLFLQQLGYVFLLPFFKVHALCFPDQSWLVVFGRLLLLGAYGVTGAWFWRAATKLGGFSTAEKLAGLAALFAWVPFQIFAFSYNTTAYLLIIVLVATWLTRDPARLPRHATLTAGLLTGLTYTHPTCGLLLIFAATLEAGWRFGPRAALRLAATTAGLGLAVLGVIYAVHGADFPRDLLEAVNFTRSFGSGEIILSPPHLTGLLTLLGLAGLFLGRIRRGRAFPYPLGAESPALLRWATLAAVVPGLSALLGLIVNWKLGYLPVAWCLGLLLVLAVSVGPADGQPPALRPGNRALQRWALLLVLGGGLAALFAVLLATRQCQTGQFALAVFFALLILLAGSRVQSDARSTAGLAVIGVLVGTVFAGSSANGLPSFGVGAAALIPFLVLFAGRRLQPSETGRSALLAAVLPPAVGLMMLLNGMLSPYREQPFWKEFKPVTGVPAFRGIRTSPLKIRAIELFQQASPWGTLQGKRILVLGSHPWLNFVLGGEPATPVLFMKFDGKPEAYELVARRLSRRPQPDVVVLTEHYMPPAIARWFLTWTRPDLGQKTIPLTEDFRLYFKWHTGGVFASEVFILTRQPGQP
ncbi:MAG: hypothetical protein PSV13_12385 [Lacunisphaera sp.]|nr:hypothetical protein [Lacunisphaera sp.]